LASRAKYRRGWITQLLGYFSIAGVNFAADRATIQDIVQFATGKLAELEPDL